jgi:hypothetical protein
MTFLGIIITLIIGILMLISGVMTKKKWLKVLSLIPLAISIVQIIMLFMI